MSEHDATPGYLSELLRLQFEAGVESGRSLAQFTVARELEVGAMLSPEAAPVLRVMAKTYRRDALAAYDRGLALNDQAFALNKVAR